MDIYSEYGDPEEDTDWRDKNLEGQNPWNWTIDEFCLVTILSNLVLILAKFIVIFFK
ncbi:MAG: hypothetical protein ACFFFH_09390 [Candidatus Thorarchaeota archaeon]